MLQYKKSAVNNAKLMPNQNITEFQVLYTEGTSTILANEIKRNIGFQNLEATTVASICDAFFNLL